MQGRYVSLAATFVLIGACVLLFQNCSVPGGVAQSQSSSLTNKMGGDQGYEGKLTYTSPRSTGNCLDGSNVESTVEMDSDYKRAYLTRQSCKDISPTEISIDSLDLLPHNLKNLVTAERFFEKKEAISSGNTVVFCRGKASGPSDYNFTVTDVVDTIVKSTGKDTYAAWMVYARYDLAGNIVSSRSYPEKPVQLWTVPSTPGQIYFDYLEGGTRLWHLNVKPVGAGPGDLTTGGVVFYDSGLGVWEFPCHRLM